MSPCWSAASITKLHIELSNYCNAACPGCPRFHNNSPWLAPGVELGQIYLDRFVRWFPGDFLSHIRDVLFCGTHGDPATARDLLGICRYVLSSNPGIRIQINTNGGIRSGEFWSELGRLFAGTDSVVIFSIDGLEDTNHLYRRNVSWQRAMDNAKAYIDSGAEAQWHYLVFKHNQHQIDEARRLGTELGFSGVWLKRAVGFEYGSKLGRMPVIGLDGVLERWIDPPDDHMYRNLSQVDNGDIFEPNLEFDPGTYKIQQGQQYSDQEPSDQVNSASINCKSLSKDKVEIYVDCHGMVHPCCWIGHTFNTRSNLRKHEQLRKMMRGNENRLDLNLRPIQDLLDDGCLQEMYANSWHKPSCKDGKLIECAVTCGSSGSAIDRIDLKNMDGAV